ncbi:MAG: methyltransferase domain-containing protein [Candidatus Nanopelagicales bacterium]
MNQPRDDAVVQIASLFDGLATSYDEVGVDFFGPIADELVGRLAPTRGESLLDIGCGKGRVLISAAERAGPNARLMGIDVSPGMLAEARTTLDKAGLTQVELLEMDAQNPQLAAAPFDVVASSLVLFFLPDPVRALRAWRRLLRPDGRVGITTFGDRDPRWEDVDSVFTPYLPAKMLDARTSGATGPFGSDAGVEDLFRQAGFTDVQTWHAEVGVVFADADHWRTWTMSVGQRAMWQAVPAEKVAEVQKLAAQRLSHCIGDDGRIHLTQTIRTTVAFLADPARSWALR